jgi:division/cell wall cluster transcriptional repressor MraZ
MVSRKTQLAWMAAGGVLSLITIVVSCKVCAGNRCAAEGANPSPSIPVVPLPPEAGTPLPPINDKNTPPTVSDPPADTKPVSPPLPAVQPAPEASLPTARPEMPPPPVHVPSPAPPVITGFPAPTPPITPPTVPPAAPMMPPLSQVMPPSILIQPPPLADPGAAGAREPGEPPLAPQPGPVIQYHVRQGGEFLQDIARRTLGNGERWTELVRLNPNLSHEARLAGGTVLRLPADACVPTEELEAVRPLPGLKPVKAETVKPEVVLPLTGTFPCNLDDNRTLLLPKAIRDQLGSTDTVMVSPGADQCLWLTNQAHLERMAQRLEQSQAKEVDVRTFKRLYFAQTQKAALNAEGRVVISDRLAQFAGLHQEVVLVGIDDHFELWDVARWKSFTQKKSAAARATIVAEQE